MQYQHVSSRMQYSRRVRISILMVEVTASVHSNNISEIRGIKPLFRIVFIFSYTCIRLYTNIAAATCRQLFVFFELVTVVLSFLLVSARRF